MKMMAMVLFMLILASFTFAEILRFSGSNQDTILSSFTTLTYYPPEFAGNMTMRVNSSDDGDAILWCNYTLLSPSGVYVINVSNGTRFGDWVNSSKFLVNESGTYNWTIVSDDNNTINESYGNMTGSFTITDNLYSNPSEIVAVIPIFYTANYTFKLWTDSREYLNFSVNNSIDSTFNVTITSNYTSINSTHYTYYDINLTSSATSTAGLHIFNMTLERLFPFSRNFTIGINITISDNYGDVEFKNPQDYSFSACEGTYYHTMEVTNLGNYPMTDCRPTLVDAAGREVGAGTVFTLGAGSNATAKVSYQYLRGSIDTYFVVTCTASPSGAIDKTTVRPKISFSQGSCGGSVTTGGGVSPYEEIPPPKAVISNVTQRIELCGNGVVDEGEDLLTCSADVAPDLLNLEKIFCEPIFDCGHWKDAFFVQSILLITVIGLILGYQRGKNTGQLANYPRKPMPKPIPRPSYSRQ